jgi:DNA-binding Lrp family transcriptional regulator
LIEWVLRMVQICMLINAEKISVFDVVKKLEKTNGIIEAFPTFGRFDVVAFGDVEKRDEIGPLVKKVSALEGVMKTETMVER